MDTDTGFTDDSAYEHGWDNGYADGVNDGYQTGWNAATGEITLSGHDVIGPKVNTDKETYTTETKYTVYTQAEYNTLQAQYNGVVRSFETYRQTYIYTQAQYDAALAYNDFSLGSVRARAAGAIGQNVYVNYYLNGGWHTETKTVQQNEN